MFEVSSRTIYRDIDTINMAGIPIRSTPGVGGGFEIMEKYKVDKNVFSADDLSTILLGLSSVSDMVQTDKLVNALSKVKSFIPTESAKEIEFAANQIHIDLSSWIGNKNIQLYLKIIKVALQEKQILLFDYEDRYRNKSTRKVEPYQLVLKSNHWYLWGYCHERNDFRLFRLSRISNLQMLPIEFSPRDYEKPQLDFSDVLIAMQQTIKIRIHNSIKDSVLDFCGYENF